MNMKENDTKKGYDGYSAEDLLQDDFFIASMTNPTKESENYWSKALEDGELSIDSYLFARYFVESMRVRSETLCDDEKEDMLMNIEKRANTYRRKRRLMFRLYFSVASSVVVLIVAGWLSLNLRRNVDEVSLTKIEDVKLPDHSAENIQLVLSGDESVSLEGEEAEITYKDGEIEINNEKKDIQKPARKDVEIAYNQLIVPHGKRSSLTLSDGTRIWVNTATRVIYPVVFDKKQREIYVDGEVFLDVAHDDKVPFIIKTKTFSAEVLGTSFNVTAYETDTLKHLVLVNGKVRIHIPETEQDITLSPNEMMTLEGLSTNVQTVNTEYYTSWKVGVYQYEQESLRNILRRLSRYYGQEIVCDPKVASLSCSGKLDLKDDLAEVLRGISMTAPVSYKYIYETHTITNK